jgi:hypothetical protein
MVLTLALQWSVVSLAPRAGYFLVAGTGSSVATEYFGAAQSVGDPAAYCRTYPQAMAQGHHVATHPPGAVLTYWLLLRVYHSRVCPSATFAALAEMVIGAPREAIAQAAASYPGMILAPKDVGAALFCCVTFGTCAALAILPLYRLARHVTRRSTALLVCALFALAPGPVLFFQGLDALIALLCVTGLALATEAVTRGRPAVGAAAGLLLGLCGWITFGAGAAVVVVGASGVWLACRTVTPLRRRAWAAMGAGAVAWLGAMAALHLACGGQLPAIFAQAMRAHRALTWVGFHRDYPTWVLLNLVEIAVFAGFPTVARIVEGGASIASRRAAGLVDVIGLVTLAVLLALNFAGSVRGEVGRVWLFLMPPLMLWAGARLSVPQTARRRPAALALVVTLLQTAALGLALTPVMRPY